jgi:hypothetical protein
MLVIWGKGNVGGVAAVVDGLKGWKAVMTSAATLSRGPRDSRTTNNMVVILRC